MTAETREEWLNNAADLLNDMLAERTALTPSTRILIAAGFPRRDRGGRVVGQCWAKKAAQGVHHIFISPMLPSPEAVLPALLHELIHAADDCESSHKGAFRKAWKALGFVGKPTECTPGEELALALKAVAKELGPYPHTVLSPVGGPKKQTTRMLKVECVGCGCVVRMTRKWLDEVGAPRCACGDQMEEAA